MSGLRLEKYAEPSSFVIGLGDLRRAGVTPRGLAFLALEPTGAIHVAVPAAAEDLSTLKVGDKLAIEWPLPGRFYHFDSVHRLRDRFFLFNGDRRLTQPGNVFEVASLVADFLKASTAPNVFFGCTPHMPGSWLVGGNDRVALHEAGYVEVIPVGRGLIARRVMDHRLWLLPWERLIETGRVDEWDPVFDSPFGNVLMLERRVIGERLVLTCERGLVEVDLSALPVVSERARAVFPGGYGVVGRVERMAFAVTRGSIQPWGLDDIRPATLMGAAECSLDELSRALGAEGLPST